MEKLTEVLAPQLEMGGYAGYVWSSFLVAGIVISVMTITSLRSLKRARQTLARLQQANTSSTHNEA